MVSRNTYLHIAKELISIIDQGHSESLDVIRSKMSSISLLDYLDSNYYKLSGSKCKSLDLTLMTEDDRMAVEKAFSAMLSGYGGRERGKWGIRNNGLCLVAAWAISISEQVSVADC